MGITPPDQWAKTHGVKVGVKAWHIHVPPEVRDLVRSSSASARNLVTWFQTEVATAYPGEEWPGEATDAKVEGLLKALAEEARNEAS